MATTPKRRLTAEERRTGILDAALAVFSERGYHDASIDEIAGEAGVSKALIYEHFSSKQELYGELIARNARDLTQRVAGALSGVEVESTAERLPPDSRPSSRSSRSAAMHGGCCSAIRATRSRRRCSTAWSVRSPPR